MLPFLAAALVVALGTVLAIVLIRHSTDQSGSSGGSGAAAPLPTGLTRSASGVSTTPKPPPSSASSSGQSSTRSAPSSSPPSSSPTGPPTAQELARAVTDYYSLVPGNTQAGWERLTDRYRRTTSQGRANYERFWGSMRRVTVDDVVATPPGTVVATLTYYLNNGSSSRERTRFGVVRDGAVLKIDSSQVV